MTIIMPLTIEPALLLAAFTYHRGHYRLSAQRLTELLRTRYCLPRRGKHARSQMWTLRSEVAILLGSLLEHGYIIPLHAFRPSGSAYMLDSRNWRRARYRLTWPGEGWRLELKCQASRLLNGGAAC